MKYTLFALLTCLLLVSGCKKEDQREVDEALIQEYITTNNLQTTSTSSGLHYIINNAGSGGAPSLAAVVDVTYVGYLLNGTEFDSGSSEFPLSNLIPGWQEGIPKIEKGGDIKLIIPSHLGYGSRDTGSIPKNSVLVFDIVLNNFF